MYQELTDTQCFIFLHPSDHQKAWDGNEGWTGQTDDWWRTQDLQKFGNKQIELTAQGLVYRPVIMEMVPEQLTEGPNAGKWVLRIEYKSIDLKMAEDEDGWEMGFEN